MTRYFRSLLWNLCQHHTRCAQPWRSNRQSWRSSPKYQCENRRRRQDPNKSRQSCHNFLHHADSAPPEPRCHNHFNLVCQFKFSVYCWAVTRRRLLRRSVWTIWLHHSYIHCTEPKHIHCYHFGHQLGIAQDRYVDLCEHDNRRDQFSANWPVGRCAPIILSEFLAITSSNCDSTPQAGCS